MRYLSSIHRCPPAYDTATLAKSEGAMRFSPADCNSPGARLAGLAQPQSAIEVQVLAGDAPAA
jgi:hypothetical protein